MSTPRLRLAYCTRDLRVVKTWLRIYIYMHLYFTNNGSSRHLKKITHIVFVESFRRYKNYIRSHVMSVAFLRYKPRVGCLSINSDFSVKYQREGTNGLVFVLSCTRDLSFFLVRICCSLIFVFGCLIGYHLANVVTNPISIFVTQVRRAVPSREQISWCQLAPWNLVAGFISVDSEDAKT